MDSKASLMDYTKSLDPPRNIALHDLFSIRQTTPQEVLKEIKLLRLDTSTGPDLIPVKFLKPVSESLANPLTNIINSFIKFMDFPKIWKQARITPIPKVSNPMSNNDYRPISILPVLSKIYEKIVFNQLTDFIESQNLLSSKISGFGKGHSPSTVLLAIRDDIIKAKKCGEVTLMVLADFYKAFDTVNYRTVLHKMSQLSFSKSYLEWTIKRECPLRPSHIKNIWHTMKNQNFSYSSQRYPWVSLETWCDFFLEIFF